MHQYVHLDCDQMTAECIWLWAVHLDMINFRFGGKGMCCRPSQMAWNHSFVLALDNMHDVCAVQ